MKSQMLKLADYALEISEETFLKFDFFLLTLKYFFK